MLRFSAKLKSDTASRGSLVWPATALTPDETKRFMSVGNKTEIDKHAHQWQPEGDERAKLRGRDVLRRGRRFCGRRLLPGVLSSDAAGRVTSSLAS